jgi:hypothetical protein
MWVFIDHFWKKVHNRRAASIEHPDISLPASDH